MKGIKLTERIYYLASQDEEGHIGIMTLVGENGKMKACRSIESQVEFRMWFNLMTQWELVSSVTG